MGVCILHVVVILFFMNVEALGNASISRHTQTLGTSVKKIRYLAMHATEQKIFQIAI